MICQEKENHIQVLYVVENDTEEHKFATFNPPDQNTVSKRQKTCVRDRLRNLKAGMMAGQMELIDIYLGRSGRTEGPCANDLS